MIGQFQIITLEEVKTGNRVQAEIIPLNREFALTAIDNRWWNEPWLDRKKRYTAEDRCWRWRKLVGYFQSRWYVQRLAVVTSDGECQGAIIFNPNYESCLVPGEGAVYVEYLAAAPRN